MDVSERSEGSVKLAASGWLTITENGLECV